MDFIKIEGVQCESCGKIHNLNDKTFISFHGNVTIGKDGGIYGNSTNTKISVFCKNTKCLSSLIEHLNDNVEPLEIGDKEIEEFTSDTINEIKEEKSIENTEKESFTEIKDNTNAFDPKNFE